ncbi:thioesterase family protein [Nocardioides jishulii]|uniref:Thioesterase family protein n=1 Tax=Nocardioides jishulii TaxID=2575440 RepID=A0A4U2YQ10_9ACTN|nr:thioesterase family protein [Nocardioides jishulii]QCX27916.1 thioesterase family protein [Nocardioides jishulii]TKI62722.1 thioesterase family protein [Nocardioides jishulii]
MRADASWKGKGGIFGGKVIALLADCVRMPAEVDRLELASLWVEFSGSVVPGEADETVEVLHAGRSTATVRAVLEQDGRAKASAMAKLVAAGQASVLPGRTLPPAASPDDLDDLVAPWGALDYDPKLQVKVIDQGLVDGVITTRAWLRVRPGHGDDLGVGGIEGVLLDLLPPGLFFTQVPPSFVPTIDFALQLNPSSRAETGEWYWGEMRTEWSDGEFCAETGELRRPDGTFVARGTQTRRIVA